MWGFLRNAVVVVLLCTVSLSAYGEMLDLNSADAAVIAETMKGVGPVKAAAIVSYRAQHGPFSSLNELTRVKGIGPKTIEQNRSRVTVLLPRQGR